MRKMEIVISFVVSLLLGMIPEVLYFTLFIIYTKNIKEKKLKLFILISLAYILCIMISQYKVLYYVLLIFLIYLFMKILYKQKTQIIDVFIISLSEIYLALTSYFCFLFVKEDFSNYYILCLIQKLILFLPFIIKEKFNIIYKLYCSLWNRNYEKKQPIKSITLRNISLISLNLFIFVLNLMIIYLISKVR